MINFTNIPEWHELALISSINREKKKLIKQHNFYSIFNTQQIWNDLDSKTYKKK